MPSPNSGINNTTEVTLPRDPDEQPPKREAVRRELKLKFHHFHSLVLSLLYSPTLTPICDYWKNHSFD